MQQQVDTLPCRFEHQTLANSPVSHGASSFCLFTCPSLLLHNLKINTMTTRFAAQQHDSFASATYQRKHLNALLLDYSKVNGIIRVGIPHVSVGNRKSKADRNVVGVRKDLWREMSKQYWLTHTQAHPSTGGSCHTWKSRMVMHNKKCTGTLLQL